MGVGGHTRLYEREGNTSEMTTLALIPLLCVTLRVANDSENVMFGTIWAQKPRRSDIENCIYTTICHFFFSFSSFAASNFFVQVPAHSSVIDITFV